MFFYLVRWKLAGYENISHKHAKKKQKNENTPFARMGYSIGSVSAILHNVTSGKAYYRHHHQAEKQRHRDQGVGLERMHGVLHGLLLGLKCLFPHSLSTTYLRDALFHFS
jgi:hypothetical protein